MLSNLLHLFGHPLLHVVQNPSERLNRRIALQFGIWSGHRSRYIVVFLRFKSGNRSVDAAVEVTLKHQQF
jgi:hypothetical protein